MNNNQLARLKTLQIALGRYLSGTIKPSRNNSFGTIPQKYSPEYPLNKQYPTNKNKRAAFDNVNKKLTEEFKRRANAGLGVPKLLKNMLNQNAEVRRLWFAKFPTNAAASYALAEKKFKNQLKLRKLENNLLARFISLNKVRTPREKEAVETFKKYYFSPDPMLRGKIGRGRQKLNQERERRVEEKSPQRPPNNAGLSARKEKFRQWRAAERSAKRRSIMR